MSPSDHHVRNLHGMPRSELKQFLSDKFTPRSCRLHLCRFMKCRTILYLELKYDYSPVQRTTARVLHKVSTACYIRNAPSASHGRMPGWKSLHCSQEEKNGSKQHGIYEETRNGLYCQWWVWSYGQVPPRMDPWSFTGTESRAWMAKKVNIEAQTIEENPRHRNLWLVSKKSTNLM